MPARYINAVQIMHLHNEANPHNPISYGTALQMKKNCIKLHDEEFGKVQLYSKKLIPFSWYEYYYGESAFSCKKSKKK